jgi:hypothetical protein
MGFLRRHCWHCAAGESAHPIVAARRKSPFEFSAFLVCPYCQMPSCALLQSSTIADVPDSSFVDHEGDIQESSWKVIDLWPSRGSTGPASSIQSACPTSEPAEKTYKRALDMAKHVRANSAVGSEIDNPSFAAVARSSPNGNVRGFAGERRLTLREFSERLISSQPKRDI